jgi:hypothetical protein
MRPCRIPNRTLQRCEARLFLTAVFWGITKPFMDGREAITGVETILDCRRDGFDTFMIGTEAVIRINNEAEVSSEILDAWTDSDKMPEDWSYDCEVVFLPSSIKRSIQ